MPLPDGATDPIYDVPARYYESGWQDAVHGYAQKIVIEPQYQASYDQGYHEGMQYRPFDPGVRQNEM